MLLASARTARCCVVVADDAPEPVRFAARELASYLGRLGRTHIAVSMEAPPHLLPLRVRLEDGDEPSLPEPSAGFDGYRIAADDMGVEIVGANPRGALYGVYDVLERLGCRWYYPTIDPQDGEIVPARDIVELPSFTAAEASPFQYRVCHPSSMIYNLRVSDALAQTDWAAKARYNVMLFLLTGPAIAGLDETGPTDLPAQALEAGAVAAPPALETLEDFYRATAEYETSGVAPALQERGMLLEGPNHCMIHLLPNELFAEHPDWFGELDGERRPQGALGPEFCWSHPEAVQYFVDACVDWLRANPHLDVFSCAPNDGGKACTCARCADLPSTDRYARLMNTLFDAMQEAGLPVELEILGGYNPVLEPPRTVALNPAVRVHWAHWGRRHDESYAAPDYALRDNLALWQATGSPLTMVNYYTDAFATPPVFPPLPGPYEADNGWLAEQGFAGVASLMFPHESWWAYTLNAWLAVTWYYPGRRADDLLQDYCRHYLDEPQGGALTEVMALLAEHVWLTYYCCGPRWTEPMWMDLDQGERAAPLLERLSDLLGDAAIRPSAGTEAAYRRDRVLRQTSALVLMGQTRIANMPLVADLAGLRAGEDVDRSALERAMLAALAYETEVVDPAVHALRELVGVLPRGWEGDKVVGGAARDLAADLAAIAPVRQEGVGV